MDRAVQVRAFHGDTLYWSEFYQCGRSYNKCSTLSHGRSTVILSQLPRTAPKYLIAQTGLSASETATPVHLAGVTGTGSMESMTGGDSGKSPQSTREGTRQHGYEAMERDVRLSVL